MKKLICTLALSSVLILTAGCGEEKQMKCTLSQNNDTNGYQLTSTYNITSQNGIVKKVQTEENIESGKEEIINAFKQTLETTYSSMNENYGGYDYNITAATNKLTSKVTIDYEKVDLEKLAKNEPSTKSMLNSKNQVTLSGLQKVYENMGATCK